MKVLPFRFYGDPAEVADELKQITEVCEPRIRRNNERTRILKGQRIRALVKQAMRGIRR
jgi:hypothetical protein